MTWWIGPLESAHPAEAPDRGASGAALANPVMSKTAKRLKVWVLINLRIDPDFPGRDSDWQVGELRVEVDVLCRSFISDLL
jgi:hypothetical protein